MKQRADQIMTKKMVTIDAGSSLEDAQAIMKLHHFRHLPVVDFSGTIIGILSDRDIQRALRSSVDLGHSGTISSELDPTFKVYQFMGWPVQTVFDDESVAAVAHKMLIAKISAFLVTNRSNVKRGIVTTDDLLKLLVALLEKQPSGKNLSLNEAMDGSLWM